MLEFDILNEKLAMLRVEKAAAVPRESVNGGVMYQIRAVKRCIKESKP